MSAEFVTGAGGGTRVLSERTGFADVYAAELVPATLGRTWVAVIGSRRVAAIVAGGVTTHGRVVVVPIEESGDIRVLDTAGRRINLP